jgi:hypothetical protein
MADYANRSDLRNPVAKMAPKGQGYGEAGQQLAAQSAVPMGASPGDMQAQAATRMPGPMPGSVVDLNAPTQRPDMPMNNNFMADMPPQKYSFGDPVMDQIKELYYAYPNDDLAQLIAAYDRYFR